MVHRTIETRVAALLAIALHASGAWAEGEALPVHVSFEFGMKMVANLFPDAERAQVQAGIARAVAERCKARFRHWEFLPTAEAKHPRLLFRLRSAGGEIALTGTFLADAAAPIDVRWSVPVFEPGEIDAFGVPSAENWPAKVLATVDEMLAGKEGEEIRAALQREAPLAACAPLVPSPQTEEAAGAVLPLSIERYRSLATSKFAIHFVWTGGHWTVRSVGTGTAIVYPGAGFRGITVRHVGAKDSDGGSVALAEALPILGGVQLSLVFLEEEDRLGGIILAEGP